jgi:hypothetical protein
MEALMATLIKQIEAIPTAYPAVGGLSAAAMALDRAMIWQRIESYVAHRYAERTVVWIVEGPGEFVPPLTPATVSRVEVWSGADEWETTTLDASPLGGYYLKCTGPYRFTATVGASAGIPASVNQAYRRLAEYMAAKPGKAGATSERITAGSINIEHSRDEAWMAAALQNSGAADLLRPYRRV